MNRGSVWFDVLASVLESVPVRVRAYVVVLPVDQGSQEYVVGTVQMVVVVVRRKKRKVVGRRVVCTSGKRERRALAGRTAKKCRIGLVNMETGKRRDKR